MAMLSHRIFPRLSFVVMVGSMLLLALSGCLAQQADVKRMQATLEKKITELDRRGQALEETLEEARKTIDQQTAYAKQLFRVARARSKQDIREMRDEELAKVQSGLKQAELLLVQSRERVDELQRRLDSLPEVLRTQQSVNEERLAALEQTQQDQLTMLGSDQETLRRELAQVQARLQEDLGNLVASMNALGPTLESLARKIDRRLDEQDRAIEANMATTQSLHRHLVTVQSAIQDALPALELPPPGEPSAVSTTPPGVSRESGTRARDLLQDLDVLGASAEAASEPGRSPSGHQD